MPDYTLPFPGKELAQQELSYDVCYSRIPQQDRARIVQSAWQKGEQAAHTVFRQWGGETDFFAIAQRSGLACLQLEKDYIVGKQRYFSDYLSGKNEIKLYLGSIRLWAQQNGLALQTALNVILSHEYFHFLECTQLGLTSREYQVPMLCIGRLKLGKTGVRALSEIGAHAFARTYYELTAEKERADEKTQL